MKIGIISMYLIGSFVSGMAFVMAQTADSTQKKYKTRGVFLEDYVRPDDVKVVQVETNEVTVFHSNVVYFGNDEKAKSFVGENAPTVTGRDNGRIIQRKMTIHPIKHTRIKAIMTVEPILKKEEDRPGRLYDNYDKSGMITVQKEGYPALEILKFVTSFGQARTHEIDLTHIAAFLQGECTFEGHVDTWVSPGFRLSLKLVYENLSETTSVPKKGDWIMPLFYDQNIDFKKLSTGSIQAKVMVPEKVKKVYLYLLTSGHGSNKEGAGEFKSRIHTIHINKTWRFMQYSPWRNDGYKYRDINPSSGRWSWGHLGTVWSSDFGRSGWMPGNLVEPKIQEITRNMLLTGENTFHFYVENIQPKDDKGAENWRVSCYLVGYY